jgi:hypothetical protein
MTSRCTLYDEDADACVRNGCQYDRAFVTRRGSCYDPQTHKMGWSGVKTKQFARESSEFVHEAQEFIQLISPREDSNTDGNRNGNKFESMRAQAQSIFDEALRSIGGRRNIDRVVALTIQNLDYKANERFDADTNNPEVQIRLGDVVYKTKAFGTRRAQHYGLYIGGGYVVEVTAGFGDKTPLLEVAKLCTFQPVMAMVALGSLSAWIDTGVPIAVVHFATDQRRSRVATVQAAIASIGQFRYVLPEANCEHFARYTATGKWESTQANFMGKIASPLTVPLRAASKVVAAPLQALRRAAQYVAGSAVDEGAGCRMAIAREPHGELVRDPVRAQLRRGRSAAHLSGVYVCMTCVGGDAHCYDALEFAAIVRRQLEAGRAPHDIVTGYVLSDAQLRVIRDLVKKLAP